MSSRPRRVAVSALLLVLIGSLLPVSGLVPPASAKVFNIIPADETETPTDSFQSDQALIAIGTTDFLGATICVVPETTVLDPLGSNTCGAAWGGKNDVVGLGTFFLPIAGPPLKVGTWRLLADGGTFPDSDRLSIPFTVSACSQCDTTFADAILADWKALAGQMQPAMGGMCGTFELMGTLGQIKAAGGVIREGISGGLALTASFAGASLGFGIAVLDLPQTSQDWALKLAQHVACRAELMYQDIAQDPPDPNTHVVEPPHFAALPSSFDPVVDAYVEAVNRVQAYGDAERIAFERYTAAMTATDAGGVAIQSEAIAEFGGLLTIAMDDAVAATRALADDVEGNADLNDPVVAAGDLPAILAVRARVTADGFTPGELAQLQDLGLSAADIAAARALFAPDRAGVPVDTGLADVLRDAADVIEAGIPAFDLFAREASVAAAKADVTAQASFTATPLEGPTPLEVTFTDTTSNPDGDPLEYLWSFDDGTTSTEASPVHTFTAMRDHFVRLDVTDVNSGRPSFASAVIRVNPVGTPPKAFFQLPRYTYQVGDTIHLTDLSTDLEGPIASRNWFGGDQFSDFDGAETDVTFTGAGSSTIMLQVTDSDGWVRSYERVVGVFDTIPIPSRQGCPSPIPGSGLDSRGNEFMLAFPRGYQAGGGLHLYLTGDLPSTGFVEIPGLDFEQDFSVTPGSVTQVDIPGNAITVGSDYVDRRAIRVCADQELSVYGANQQGATTDAFLGLPTDALGTDYAVMSIGADISHFSETSDERSQLSIVGVTDGTIVQITPPIAVGIHPAGVPFAVDLDRLMTFQLRADLDRQDLTGTILQSNHPIAVFGGASCTDIPFGVSACDHVVEQLPPTRTWGTNFSVVSLAARTGGDVVRILARESGTSVTVDGVAATTLGAGKFLELDFASGSTHVIQTGKPALVAQFAKSLAADFDSIGTGDPFMMLVTPTEQFADHYTMISPDFGYNHFLNLVVRAEDEATCTIDGEAPEVAGQAIGTTGLVGIREPVAGGTHNLACPHPFGVSAYGWSTFESYGYPGGSKLDTIVGNRDPIAADDTAATTAGVAIAVDVVANDSDPDADTLSVTTVTTPAHGTAVIQPDGSILYTPTAGFTGEDAFDYTVGDGRGGTDSATVSVTIGPAGNAAPTLAAIADASVPELTLFSTAAVGADQDQDVLVYSVTSGPSGLSVDPSTGAISWTPTEAQGPGSYPVTIRVTDPGTLFAEQTFTVGVTEVNAPPTLGVIVDLTVRPGETATTTAVGADADVPLNTLAYSIDSGPGSIGGSSGAFSWTPALTDLGDHTVSVSVADGVGGSATRSFVVHVVRTATSLTLGGDTTGQYSDVATVTALLKAGSDPIAGATVSLTFGAASTSATTGSDGIASATFPIPGPAGAIARGASFAGSTVFAGASESGTFAVVQEDATVAYSGDSTVLIGTAVQLRATVVDSAATGFDGVGPETDASRTLGDVTRMRVAFDVYAAGTCLTGSPVASFAATATDVAPAGDGIGQATASWSGAGEGSYCVAVRLIGATAAAPNAYYVTPPALPGGLAVYRDATGFVTGGGWLTDDAGQRANLGFNAKTGKSGPKGQLVFVTRSVVDGKRVILVIKSNALDSLLVTGRTFPISATLSGKASYKVIGPNGVTISESGGATFVAAMLDTDEKGGAGDGFGIRVLDKRGVVLVDLALRSLGGGNVVVHEK